MYHSITFGEKNTWDDWHLIPSSRPTFAPPALKEKYIDIPGANGLLDLSSYLTGRPSFSNRVGTFEFIVVNGYSKWEELYSEIMNYVHGKYMRIYLEDDPGYFYEGRFTVNQWKSQKAYSVITLNYSVKPYKKLLSSTSDQWLWDPLNFETGHIVPYCMDLEVDGDESLSVTIIGSQESVVPSFTTSAAMTVLFNGTEYPIPKGYSVVPAIVFTEGENTVVFSGTGTVFIDYRGGSL